MEGQCSINTLDDLTREKREKGYIYKNWLSDDDIWKYLFSKKAENKGQIEYLDPQEYRGFSSLVGGDCCNIIRVKGSENVGYYLCISRNSADTHRIQNICFCKQDKKSLYIITENELQRFMTLRHFVNSECTRWILIGFKKPSYEEGEENPEADMECFRNAEEAMQAFAEIVKEIKEEKSKNELLDQGR